MLHVSHDKGDHWCWYHAAQCLATERHSRADHINVMLMSQAAYKHMRNVPSSDSVNDDLTEALSGLKYITAIQQLQYAQQLIYYHAPTAVAAIGLNT